MAPINSSFPRDLADPLIGQLPTAQPKTTRPGILPGGSRTSSPTPQQLAAARLNQTRPNDLTTSPLRIIERGFETRLPTPWCTADDLQENLGSVNYVVLGGQPADFEHLYKSIEAIPGKTNAILITYRQDTAIAGKDNSRRSLTTQQSESLTDLLNKLGVCCLVIGLTYCKARNNQRFEKDELTRVEF